MTGANFSGAYLKGAVFDNAIITGANFSNTANRDDGGTIRLESFTFAQLCSTKSYKDKDLSGIKLIGNKDMISWDFSGQNLTSADFSVGIYDRANISKSNFTGANLTGASFQSTTANSVNFTDANLSGANFFGTDMTGANFTDAIIKNANFSKGERGGISKSQLYSTKSYKDGDLCGINFTANDMSGFDFSGKNLSDCEFSSADGVSDVNFSNANLSAANFEATTLRNLDFTGANMMSANLYWASMEGGVDFTRADLRGANMEHIMGSYTVKNTIMSDGVIQNFSMNSSADSFSIRKYTPLTEDGEAISAKIAQNASIMGGAELTLETGACLEVVDGAVLSLENGSSIMVNTDVDASTLFEIDENSGLVFEAGAVLEINLDETIRALDTYTFSVITWQENSSIAGLDSLVKGETLLLSINGERFSGNWDYVLSNNQLAVSLQIPEPSTYAAIFGVLAIAFAVYSRRR